MPTRWELKKCPSDVVCLSDLMPTRRVTTWSAYGPSYNGIAASCGTSTLPDNDHSQDRSSGLTTATCGWARYLRTVSGTVRVLRHMRRQHAPMYETTHDDLRPTTQRASSSHLDWLHDVKVASQVNSALRLLVVACNKYRLLHAALSARVAPITTVNLRYIG